MFHYLFVYIINSDIQINILLRKLQIILAPAPLTNRTRSAFIEFICRLLLTLEGKRVNTIREQCKLGRKTFTKINNLN